MPEQPHITKTREEFMPLSQSLTLFTLFFERFQAFSQMMQIRQFLKPSALKIRFEHQNAVVGANIL